MAEKQDGWGEEMDVKLHLGTYDSFITASKWGSALIALTLVLMAIFLL
ncbi:aa3-type cytochrome c oxidase subunit IV [Parvibaculum sp.]|nr:aa3-type cytochrome c oxidase subunit IV [Parvibaculum sp.]MDO9127090.1 aa3-type cytochrome c oxidase subunit IV [Parvibaculum sp.]MDP1628473.1 aa3-type cytochrome c oxidase subunit IV [Parvibaculum sp.]MDP2151805.1 aa3-type cytochrome c oxidase subunit IV [Parvibaculum sp.]MDP3326928.1 aa3-type cytochrome c oxidase subunit IV [Parvibaculum sp.]